MTVASWKITLLSIRTKRDAIQQLERLLTHIAWDQPPLAPSKSDVIAKLRDTQQTIRTICKDATTHRSDFLQERAAPEALAGNEEVEKVLSQMHRKSRSDQGLLQTPTQIIQTINSRRNHIHGSCKRRWNNSNSHRTQRGFQSNFETELRSLHQPSHRDFIHDTTTQQLAGQMWRNRNGKRYS